MAEAPLWGRYSELFPDQIEAIIAANPVAYVPWGALEWHGSHLPFGVDGFTAEAVCERLVQRTGGVLLPTTWWPITALPHRFSLSIPSDVVQPLLDSILVELSRVGFKAVVIITGHYAQGHELVLIDAAEHALIHTGLLVLAVPPLALIDQDMLDHAALWETAQMLALQPRAVRLDTLGPAPLSAASSAVLGADPRGATASQGESVLALATEQIAASVQELLDKGTADSLRALYARRRAGYRSYVERYFRGSWEDAIEAWWQEQRDGNA